MSAIAEAVAVPQQTMPSYSRLHDLMHTYRLPLDAAAKAQAIHGELEALLTVDVTGELGRLPWGHHHDFGPFGISGRMGKHHLSMIAVFIDEMRALPSDLTGARVLDIGCWSGGSSLLLAAMGAEVTAIEPVPGFAACAEFLRRVHGVSRLRVEPISLYDCTTNRHQDAFDYVLCGGVLHHLSDPKLALRIIFNTLRDGGRLLLETRACTNEQLTDFLEGDINGPNQQGRYWATWNALLFTPPRLAEMLAAVGFRLEGDVRSIQFKTLEPRLFAVGRRTAHVDFNRQGLSRMDIR